MIIWNKPNGNEVTTNELPASIKAAQSHGWKRKSEPDGVVKYADMGAPELKELISTLDGVEYTTKPDAIAYLEANLPQD